MGQSRVLGTQQVTLPSQLSLILWDSGHMAGWAPAVLRGAADPGVCPEFPLGIPGWGKAPLTGRGLGQDW